MGPREIPPPLLRVRDLDAALDCFVAKLSLRELRRIDHASGRPWAAMFPWVYWFLSAPAAVPFRARASRGSRRGDQRFKAPVPTGPTPLAGIRDSRRKHMISR